MATEAGGRDDRRRPRRPGGAGGLRSAGIGATGAAAEGRLDPDRQIGATGVFRDLEERAPGTLRGAVQAEQQRRQQQRGLPAEGFAPGQALQAGVTGARGALRGAQASILGSIGATGSAERAEQEAARLNRAAARQSPEITMASDVESVSDVPAMIGNLAATQLPSLAVQLASGRLGGILGRRRATRTARGQGRRPTQREVDGGGTAGAVAGFAGSGGALAAGDISSRLAADPETRDGMTTQERSRAAVAGGTAAGLLGVATPLALLQRTGLGRTGQRAIQRQRAADMSRVDRLKRLGGATALGAGIESVTEIGQQSIIRGTVSLLNSNVDFLDRDGVRELLDAAVAGAVIGGGLGGGAQVLSDRRQARAERLQEGRVSDRLRRMSEERELGSVAQRAGIEPDLVPAMLDQRGDGTQVTPETMGRVLDAVIREDSVLHPDHPNHAAEAFQNFAEALTARVEGRETPDQTTLIDELMADQISPERIRSFETYLDTVEGMNVDREVDQTLDDMERVQGEFLANSPDPGVSTVEAPLPQLVPSQGAPRPLTNIDESVLATSLTQTESLMEMRAQLRGEQRDTSQIPPAQRRMQRIREVDPESDIAPISARDVFLRRAVDELGVQTPDGDVRAAANDPQVAERARELAQGFADTKIQRDTSGELRQVFEQQGNDPLAFADLFEGTLQRPSSRRDAMQPERGIEFDPEILTQGRTDPDTGAQISQPLLRRLGRGGQRSTKRDIIVSVPVVDPQTGTVRVDEDGNTVMRRQQVNLQELVSEAMGARDLPQRSSVIPRQADLAATALSSLANTRMGRAPDTAPDADTRVRVDFDSIPADTIVATAQGQTLTFGELQVGSPEQRQRLQELEQRRQGTKDSRARRGLQQQINELRREMGERLSAPREFGRRDADGFDPREDIADIQQTADEALGVDQEPIFASGQRVRAASNPNTVLPPTEGPIDASRMRTVGRDGQPLRGEQGQDDAASAERLEQLARRQQKAFDDAIKRLRDVDPNDTETAINTVAGALRTTLDSAAADAVVQAQARRDVEDIVSGRNEAVDRYTRARDRMTKPDTRARQEFDRLINLLRGSTSREQALDVAAQLEARTFDRNKREQIVTQALQRRARRMGMRNMQQQMEDGVPRTRTDRTSPFDTRAMENELWRIRNDVERARFRRQPRLVSVERLNSILDEWRGRLGIEAPLRVMGVNRSLQALENLQAHMQQRVEQADDTTRGRLQQQLQNVNDRLEQLQRGAGYQGMLIPTLSPVRDESGSPTGAMDFDGGFVIHVSDAIPDAVRVEVMSHELGHAIFRTMPVDQQTAQAIHDDFVAWYNQSKGGLPGDVQQLFAGPSQFLEFVNNPRDTNSPRADVDGVSQRDAEQMRQYVFDYEEWVANNMARWLNREAPEAPRTAVDRYFQEAARRMRDAAQTVSREYNLGFEPTEAVQQFMSNMFDGYHRSSEAYEAAARNAFQAAQGLNAPGTLSRLQSGLDMDNPILVAAAASSSDGALGHMAIRRMIQNDLTAEERRLLGQAFTSGALRKRLLGIMPKTAADALRNDPSQGVEEAMVYGYQAWRAGLLDVTPRIGTVYEGLEAGIARAFNVMRDSDLAGDILVAMENGTIRARAEGGALFDIDHIKHQNQNTMQRAATETYRVITEKMQPVMNAFTVAHSRMLDSGNPVLSELGSMFQIRTGDRGRDRSMFEAKVIETGSRTNRMARAVQQLNDEQRSALATALQNPLQEVTDPTVAEARDSIRTELRSALNFAREAGLKIADRGEDFFPWVFSQDNMINRREDFVSLLAQEKFREPLINRLASGIKARRKVARDKLKKAKSEEARKDLRAKIKQMDNQIKSIESGLTNNDTWRNLINQEFDKIMDNEGMADVEPESESTNVPFARSVNSRWLGFIQEVGNAQDMQTLQSFFNQDVVETLAVYTDQIVKRAEFVRRFGEDGEKLNTMLERARSFGATDKDIEMANRFVSAMMGTTGLDLHPIIKTALKGADKVFGKDWQNVDPQRLRQGQHVMLMYQNIRTLAFATMASLSDTAGVALRGDMEAAFTGYKQGMQEVMAGIRGDRTKMRELAETLGVVDQVMVLDALRQTYGGTHMTGATRKINDTFFRVIMLEQFTRMSRTMALAAGTRFIARHKDDISESSARFREELNIGQDDIMVDDGGDLVLLSEEARRSASPEELARDNRVRTALNRFVDESIIRPNAAQRPLWASHPDAALIFHLKQFTFSMQDRVLRRMGREIGEGNVQGTTALLFYLGIAMASDELRREIQGRPPESTAMGYLDTGIERAGLMGTGEFLVKGLKDRYKFGGTGLESLSGPTASQSAEIVSTAFGNRGAYTTFLNALPASNLLKHNIRGLTEGD